MLIYRNIENIGRQLGKALALTKKPGEFWGEQGQLGTDVRFNGDNSLEMRLYGFKNESDRM